MSSPKQYRKKPVVIEAMLFDGTDSCAGDVENWSNEKVRASKPWKTDYGFMDVQTLEGEMTACTGDYVIKGVKGEFYPCKPDIFEQTYEEVVTNHSGEETQ